MMPSDDRHTAVGSEPGAPETERRSVAESGSGASIDKVRDILFGNQMREVERRFARLEERLAKDTADLKDETRRRLDALEAHARREFEALADQIRAEHADRVDAHAAASGELKEASRSLERRIATLDDQLSKGHRELRQQILEQQQHLSDDLRAKVEDVLATVAREAQQLRSDKTDRAALAALLTEMAVRLTDEFGIPGAEVAGNG